MTLALTAFKLSAERWIGILLLVSVGIIVVAMVAAVAPSLRARGKHSGRRARPTASEEQAHDAGHADLSGVASRATLTIPIDEPEAHGTKRA